MSVRNVLSLVLVMALGACGGSSEKDGSELAVKAVELPGVQNLHEAEGFLLASQPDKAAFEAAKEKYGVKTVINLRMPDETPKMKEPELVKGLGLDYVALPFKGPDTLKDEIFDSARRVLKDSSKRPILMHCKSGNRVGAIWYAYRVLDEGVDPAVAMKEAKAVGLRKPGHIKKAEEYVKKHMEK
ncbi:MAG TPA: hypothetical protein ENK43_15030 [Planctomycetes bacterium]|nr:hypothetical protein [Planctomycetota bacterium]